MKKLSKLILPVIFLAIAVIMYFTYFAATNEIEDLSKFNPGSEINQQIILTVVKSKGFGRDTNGNITSFYAMDKNKAEVLVTSHEPILPEITDAEIVELLGHMHETSITASKITIIK